MKLVSYYAVIGVIIGFALIHQSESKILLDENSSKVKRGASLWNVAKAHFRLPVKFFRLFEKVTEDMFLKWLETRLTKAFLDDIYVPDDSEKPTKHAWKRSGGISKSGRKGSSVFYRFLSLYG